MKTFKCMKCNKIYFEGNFPIVKGTKLDGCCSAGSLIEIKIPYTVKDLVEELSKFNSDAEINFMVGLEKPKYGNAFALSFTLKDNNDISSEEDLLHKCKIVTFCIGSDLKKYIERKQD